MKSSSHTLRRRAAPRPNSATAEILPTHTAALFNAAVTRAAELLRSGEVVALPTETVYGLAANALDSRSVQRLFDVKGRPAHNPIIVHVASLEMARRCASVWPPRAARLARAFWPGPLTLVLPRAHHIPSLVTAGGDTVGIRWPSHPFIQAVILECGFPLAAPSANRSNFISPTNAAHVSRSLGHKIPLIVDGGQSQVGIESTVLDLAASPPRVLRPGMIHLESLQAVLRGDSLRIRRTSAPASPAKTLRSPGLLLRHYAPRARLMLLSWKDERDLLSQLKKLKVNLEALHLIAHSTVPSCLDPAQTSIIPHDPEAFARAIYAELHRCDDAGAEWIVVEALPDAPGWEAIADRLRRAAG